MSETEATWYRLLHWQYGQDAAERLTTQILLDQGYTHVEANRPLGGTDGRVDAMCRKGAQQMGVIVYFLPGEVPFAEIENKFKDGLTVFQAQASPSTRAAKGVIFVTNQEMRFSERQRLEGVAAPLVCEIFGLERLVTILEQERMAAVRQQYLPVSVSGQAGNETVLPGAILGGILGQLFSPGAGGAIFGGLLGAAIADHNNKSNTGPGNAAPNPVILPPTEVHWDEITLRFAAQGQNQAAWARIHMLLEASTQGAAQTYQGFRSALLGNLQTITRVPGTPALALLPTLVQAYQLLQPFGRPGSAEQIVLDELNDWFGKVCSETSRLFCLRQVQLQNFRGFGNLNLSLHPHLTVLVASNGLGKTTILEACRLALRPFVSGFDLSYETIGAIGLSDVHIKKVSASDQARQFPASVRAIAQIGVAEQFEWARSLSDEKNETSTVSDQGAQQLLAWATLLQNQTRQTQQVAVDLPVIAYYGTGRVLGQQALVAHDDGGSDQYIRTFGYRDCLQPKASFSYFSAWFTWVCQCRDEQRMRHGQVDKWELMIQVVRQAVDDLLREITGWHTLDYSVVDEKSLILHHPTQGILRVNQLSDGIRGILALVGDLAWRCIKLNPHLGRDAAKLATGVVLIDELDMHLHPSWQQYICAQLQSAFPKLQFILTTHSPQVLSCVPKECIRLLRMLGAEVGLEDVSYQTQGVSSADILAHIMHLDAIPPVMQAKQLSDYRAMIQNNVHDSPDGQVLFAKLVAHFGAEHPEMLECRRLIGLEAFKRKMVAKKAGLQNA